VGDRRRVATDEAEAAPPLAVFDRLEQETRLVIDELGERGHRRLEVTQDLGPDGHDAVLARERDELVERRLDLHEPNALWKQDRSPV
jgi:hypothetical protein